MIRSSRSERDSKLSESFYERLNLYALAASAAGVAALACSVPAQAKVIFRQGNLNLFGNEFLSFNPTRTKIAPFMLSNQYTNVGFYYGDWIRFHTNPSSAGAGVLVGTGGFPAALAAGAVIGPGGYFAKQTSLAGVLASFGNYGGGTSNHHAGNFQFGKVGYVGFEFFDGAGREHFGWARVLLRRVKGTKAGLEAKFSGFAYETIPGKSIQAGQTSGNADVANPEDTGSGSTTPPCANRTSDTLQPGSLGLLALGAEGIPLS